MNKKPIRMTTIKNKMLVYTLLIIFLMSLLSIYSMSIMRVYKSQIDIMFERNLKLNEISITLESVDQQLMGYLNTKSSDSLNNYMQYSDDLLKIAQEASIENLYFSEEELMVMDIHSMIENYVSVAQIAVEERRRNDDIAYSISYKNAQRIKSYINGFISELNVRQLDTNATTYTFMTNKITTSTRLNVFLIINLILLSIIIVLRMTTSMINPIIRLSHSAEEISKGKFDIKEIKVDTHDEIEILATAFNKMKLSIHSYIEEMKEKATTEAKLKDQEMENLKIQSLLDNARLFALQSQMNPHFLFNTINAGVQLSMIEGADRTSEFLESMSRLFRYNVKRLDQPVTIGEEVDNISDYYELLKVRFGDLITFEFTIEESAKKYLIPPLTLQPIVENAYIHGLSSQESGGTIKVSISNNESQSLIVIEDNGVGITRQDIKRIMNHKETKTTNKASSGIGMHNVISRLELFYKKNNLLQVASSKTKGTKVSIIIPNIEKHESFHI